MENKMYLIHEGDYIKHIDESVVLYTMLKEITRRISKLPSNRGNKPLTDLSQRADKIADSIFRTWGIPRSYAFTFNADNLAYLMENELIEPEDAGYFACDGECCCGDCECCCQTEDYDEEDEIDEDEDFNEAMTALSSIIHSIFGDNVSVHIVVE